MNRWGIPKWLEDEVRERDKQCVYCAIDLKQKVGEHEPRTNLATWEHIINDASIVTRENIALCCAPCNSSKGTKRLSEWLSSDYCKTRGIDGSTMAPVALDALEAEN